MTVPEQERDARTFGEIAPLFAADVFLPIYPAEFVQRAEDLVRQRHHDVVDFLRELFDVDLFAAASAAWVAKRQARP